MSQHSSRPRVPAGGAGARVATMAFTGLPRAGFLLRGGLLELLFYVRDAGEGADIDLVVIGLEALLALALGAASSEKRAHVAAQEAQRHREQRRVHEWEDGVYGDDRGQRGLRVRA